MVADQALIERSPVQAPTHADVVRFGAYQLDMRLGMLRKHGLPIKLAGQPLRVLRLLVERPGILVTRAELREQLWPDGVYVDFERSLNSAIKKLRRALQEDPHAPRYIETQPRYGYRFIGEVEAPPLVEPPLHLSLATEECTRVSRGAGWLAALSKGRYAVYATLALLFLFVGFGVLGFSRRAQSKTRPGPVKQAHFRSSVALLGLKNLSAQQPREWLSNAITGMLATELAQGETVRVVSAENVARAKLELGITSQEYTQEKLRALRSYLGSDYLVTGSYLSSGDGPSEQIRLDLRLQEAISGETLASVAMTGTQSELIDLVSQAGHALRTKLSSAAAPEGDVDWRTVLPANLEASRLYSQALAHLRRAEAHPATELLQRCIAIQPTFALGHASLAEAWSALGYNTRAMASAQIALSLANSLPEDERLAVEGRYYELKRDWSGAMDVYRHLWHDYPDDIDSGLRLAGVETFTGKLNEALATVSALRSIPGVAADDPRIDLAEGLIAKQAQNYDREAVLAAKVLSTARKLGAPALQARADMLAADALQHQLKAQQAEEAYAQAEALFERGSDHSGSARAYTEMGRLQSQEGDLAGARRSLEQARDLLRILGDELRLCSALNELARISRLQGDVDGAERLESEASRILEQSRSAGLS
ncbi:MAG TPA: winged helix-turn-helix domain-containing protein [Terriglobales bacterium]|nr:winged helix-turn-helix domain-containing protein [Terriglobales bacterium]